MTAAIKAAEEAAAAAAALAGATQDWRTSQASLLFTQDEEEQPGLSLLDLDKTLVIPAGQAAGADDSGGKVSTPLANDDHERVGVVDDSVKTGNVRSPAATDPLVAVGSTVGRNGAGQSQVQAGAQVQDPAVPNKKKLCKTVWRDAICRDRDCDRAHPPRCGDPRCYPLRRPTCQHWHRMGGLQQQSSQPSSQQPRQRQLQQQQQGNGHGAGPGRAGWHQARGKLDGQRRQGPRRQHQQGQGRQLLQRRFPTQGRQQQQPPQGQQQPQQRQQGQGRQLQQRQVPSYQLLLQQQQQQQGQGRQLQQRQFPSYRDVAALGTPHSHSAPSNVGFAPAQPDRDMLSTVVATVMAVLAGRQHF